MFNSHFSRKTIILLSFVLVLPGAHAFSLNNPLFIAEYALDSVRLIIPMPAQSKVNTALSIAEKRVQQLEQGTAEGKSATFLGLAAKSYSSSMNRATSTAEKSGNTELVNQVKTASSRHSSVLQQVKSRVPEEAQSGLTQAIDASQNAQTATPAVTQKSQDSGSAGSQDSASGTAGQQSGSSNRP